MSRNSVEHFEGRKSITLCKLLQKDLQKLFSLIGFDWSIYFDRGNSGGETKEDELKFKRFIERYYF